MRVLHLTRDFHPRCCGGLSTAVGGMVRATQQAGVTNAVVSFDAWRPRSSKGPAGQLSRDEQDGVSVLRLRTGEHLSALPPFAREFDPDLLHVHDGMLWSAASDMQAELSVPTALTVHVLHSELQRIREITVPTMSLQTQAQALSEVDGIFAPSKTVTELLHERYPQRAHAITHTPLGIADSPQARRDAASRKPRDPLQPARLLYVGRLADVNGTQELFGAFEKLLATRPHLRLVVAGGIPESPRHERRWLRRYSETVPSRLRQQVELLGWLKPAALAEERSRADMVIAPSWFETFGLSVLESMLAALPIVSCKAGALPELLTHQDTALLCPPKDAGALAAAIDTMLDQPEVAWKMGQRAAARARSTRLWSHSLPMLLAAYQTLSQGHDGNA